MHKSSSKRDVIEENYHSNKFLNYLLVGFTKFLNRIKKTLKKLYGPFLWMGFNYLKATAISRRQFTFYHSVSRNSWCSFYRPRKYERLSRPWSHPVVLNTGPLDWESSALTTRQLLHSIKYIKKSHPQHMSQFFVWKGQVFLCKGFSNWRILTWIWKTIIWLPTSLDLHIPPNPI